MKTPRLLFIICALLTAFGMSAVETHTEGGVDYARLQTPRLDSISILTADMHPPDSVSIPLSLSDFHSKGTVPNIYEMPYSFTKSYKNWKRLWINTGILTGAFVGTLLVLECLPEDATSWNRASLQKVPLGKRWYNHVLKDGPEWDHDKFIFNYVLHPYAGAAYFMGARSSGFNFYQSMLYSTIISNILWEFGIEAFMERPSYQDLFITPLVGSAIGECFYKVKRHIVNNGYRLLDSSVLGNIIAFLVDPLNEVVGYFGNSRTRAYARQCREAITGKSDPLINRRDAKCPKLTCFPTPFYFSLTLKF